MTQDDIVTASIAIVFGVALAVGWVAFIVTIYCLATL